MKTLYIECHMGAAGDMLLAALLDLLGEPDVWTGKLNALGLPDVHISCEAGIKCGLRGLRAAVTVHGHAEDGHHHEHHSHTGLSDIQKMIAALPLPQKVRDDAAAVYQLIASAEAEAHGCPVDLVHFHEVGALDAVADVAGVCLLMDALSPGRIAASPVHVGCGEVQCAHGVLPVPAPATAALLRGVPVYGGEVRGELCTPTGAALLRYFVKEYIPLPLMAIEKTGIGLGKKDFAPRANCVRLFWGDNFDGGGALQGGQGANGTVAELCCNLDDMTGEEIGYAVGALFGEGALDVFTVAAQSKKNRPGVLLSVLCREGEADRFAALMLKYTSTFGVRKRLCERYTLERSVERRGTPYGPVEVKTGEGYGVRREKAEYESAAEAARARGVPLRDVTGKI
ncbi:MAG: nickel pincer cofactor biosynthesis protein LarC [Oscillospiraceae bacterium]|nr:nickel pincer cofactor biosynthesis protein LarC [Oscillospiraceae bacterium]